MRRRTYGATLIELMVIGMVTLFLGAGIFTLVRRAWANHDALLIQNEIQRQARAAMDMVCDEIRNIAPWNEAVVGVTDSRNSAVGLKGSYQIRRDAATNRLGRGLFLGAGKFFFSTTVHNITEFNVLFGVRVPKEDGSLEWQWLSMSNDPESGRRDMRIKNVSLVKVSVTASRQGADGLLYRRTLTSVVKVRNQFYTIAPPLG